MLNPHSFPLTLAGGILFSYSRHTRIVGGFPRTLRTTRPLKAFFNLPRLPQCGMISLSRFNYIKSPSLLIVKIQLIKKSLNRQVQNFSHQACRISRENLQMFIRIRCSKTFDSCRSNNCHSAHFEKELKLFFKFFSKMCIFF